MSTGEEEREQQCEPALRQPCERDGQRCTNMHLPPAGSKRCLTQEPKEVAGASTLSLECGCSCTMNDSVKPQWDGVVSAERRAPSAFQGPACNTVCMGFDADDCARRAARPSTDTQQPGSRKRLVDLPPDTVAPLADVQAARGRFEAGVLCVCCRRWGWRRREGLSQGLSDAACGRVRWTMVKE